MSDLKLSGASAFPSPEDPTQKNAPAPAKKKSGLGCVLIGCLSLFLLIAAPIAGGLIYVATMDEADYGGVIVSLMHQDWFKDIVEETVMNDPNKTEEQKKSFSAGYEMFLKEYDKLPDADKEKIDIMLGTIFKKALKGGDAVPEDFDKEMKEIFKTIEGSMTTTPDTTSSTTTPTTPTTPTTTVTPTTTTTTPSTDPYSFDLPATTMPTTPTNTTQPSQYDF